MERKELTRSEAFELLMQGKKICNEDIADGYLFFNGNNIGYTYENKCDKRCINLYHFFYTHPNGWCILEESITDKIKTVDDAYMIVLGNVESEFQFQQDDGIRDKLNAITTLHVIAEALNEGEHVKTNGGFVVRFISSEGRLFVMENGLRLDIGQPLFKSKELAEYALSQFREIFEKAMK